EYNWKKKAEEEISLPNEAEIGMPIAIKDGVIYFANIEGKKLKVISYNGGEKSISGEREVELINNNVSGSDIAQSPVENGKFYFVPSPQDLEQLTSITVIDLDSLTVDYHGKVEASHAPRQNETAEMHFYYSELKNLRITWLANDLSQPYFHIFELFFRRAMLFAQIGLRGYILCHRQIGGEQVQ